METSPSLTGPANAMVLAKLGTSYGYHFQGDRVTLTASFRTLSPISGQRHWLLQLWACETPPLFPAQLRGQLMASAALPPFARIEDLSEPFTVECAAVLPVAAKDYALVLGLVAAKVHGVAGGEVHDVAVFPRRESFAVPRLVGGRLLAFESGRVQVAADAIENPRSAITRSATLALELWSLPAPYRGGHFLGTPVAGAELGWLEGQQRWSNVEFTWPAERPRETGQLVLMLREWGGNGFVTRDFANLPPLPATPPAPASALPAAPEPHNEPSVPVPVARRLKPARPTAKRSKVSINRASEAELAQVKGLSRAVAKSIIAHRLYARLNDLVKAKGIGPKVLAKIRLKLRLN